jgi:hypothetical protein
MVILHKLRESLRTNVAKRLAFKGQRPRKRDGETTAWVSDQSNVTLEIILGHKPDEREGEHVEGEGEGEGSKVPLEHIPINLGKIKPSSRESYSGESHWQLICLRVSVSMCFGIRSVASGYSKQYLKPSQRREIDPKQRSISGTRAFSRYVSITASWRT